MNATMRFISWGTIPVGYAIGGFLGGVIGLHNTIWVGAIGAVVSFVPVALVADPADPRRCPSAVEGGADGAD